MGETKVIQNDQEKMCNIGYNNDQLYSNGEYLVMQTFLKRGDVVVDIGANKGDWSHALLSCIIPSMIICFEPTPAFEQLYKRFFYRSNMKLFNNAVMDKNGDAKFFFYKNNSELSNFFGRPEVETQQGLQKEEIVVKMIALDDFIEQEKIEKIDYLKIDTEGSEGYVLKGCERSLAKNVPNFIQIEGGGCLKDSKTKLEDIFKFVSHYGYSVYRIFNEGLIYLDKWYPAMENYLHSNYLFISDSKAKEVLVGFPVHPMIFEEVNNGI